MLLLASQSPHRAALLRKAGIPFTVVPSDCDEETIQRPQPQVLAIERARGKARQARLTPVQRTTPGLVVLAADTVAALGLQIIGKPRDVSDAERILTLLQGTTHTVITGHCCVSMNAAGVPQVEAVGVAFAKVTMRSMTAKEVRDYVQSGEGAECSGAYAIQETADRFIIDVEGSWDTVVGLSVDTVARLYRECLDRPLPGYAKAGP